jgi:HD-GYP domain-containing protein (c-di-GMP phosphodiesterase class II)
MTESQTSPPQARLAEVVSCLSLTTDLATGQPLEHGLRRALLAVWLGEHLGLSDDELSSVYYVALLGSVGCTIESAAFARFFRDDIAVGEQIVLRDPTRPADMATFLLSRAGEGKAPLQRARQMLSLALAGPTESQIVCRDVALQLGEMLEIGAEIRESLGQCHEHWDGRGGPRKLKGEQISLATRIFLVAHDAEIYHRVGGVEAAVSVVRQRTGRRYDPFIAARFGEVAEVLLARLLSEATWEAVLEAEPVPLRLLSSNELDDIALTIANFIDLRSSYTIGHSAGVATLAATAAQRLGLPEAEVTSVRRAGLLHDLGRAGVPVALWDKREPLRAEEWERMKRHPSLTELVLARSNALGHLGVLASQHHERLDGSGYRGLTAASLPVSARLLSAADAYETRLEARPHRAGLTPERAAQDVLRLSREGRLDGDGVLAVLAAAGQAQQSKRRDNPAGLSDREVDVLGLAIRGLTNKQIADLLVVSPKTVGHHIQHIYDKIGVSTRVGAALFALQHGLIGVVPSESEDIQSQR